MAGSSSIEQETRANFRLRTFACVAVFWRLAWRIEERERRRDRGGLARE